MLSLNVWVSHHGLAGAKHIKVMRRQNRSSGSFFFHKRPQKFATPAAYSSELGEEPRRSSDYAANIWTPQIMESLHSPYDGDRFDARIEELKKEVKQLIKQTAHEPLSRLELIDSICRLGLAYHFKEEIEVALAPFYVDGLGSLHGLKETALCFRLMREHGHYVSSDVFGKFRQGEEGFTNHVSRDIEGLVSLYEATHLSFPGEQMLEEAREFSIKHLRHLCLDKNTDSKLVKQVRHSLKTSRYWLMPRLEARRHIDYYENEVHKKNPCLLELAKLDFNVVQALHQREIKELARWWQELDLPCEVKFSRDRIFESYLWTIGGAFEPQFSKYRKMVTKMGNIFTLMDKFYDIYSTLDEAELFTSAIQRLDLRAIHDAPCYLQPVYLALYDLVDETSCDILLDSGFNVRENLAREWISLCEAYLKEAQWFHKKNTPSLEEYKENGWTTVGICALLFHAFYFLGHRITKKSLDHYKNARGLIYLPSLLIRLIDDLVPSKAEMEGSSSLPIQCYMKDPKKSFEASKEYIKNLIKNYFMELNKESLNTALPRNFVDVATNAVRAFYTFQEEDTFSTSVGMAKDVIKLLFVDPISMEQSCSSEI